jgi:hypothetical protein
MIAAENPKRIITTLREVLRRITGLVCSALVTAVRMLSTGALTATAVLRNAMLQPN